LILRVRNNFLITPKNNKMKTINNFFSSSRNVKNINDFSNSSLNISQMNCIKGGTEPLTVNGAVPVGGTGVTNNI